MSANTPQPEMWVEQYSDFLYRYAYSRVNDKVTAEDLVQETFLSALKGYERFDGKSSERTWFVSILKHKIIDFYRKKSRTAKYFQEPDPDESATNYDENGYWKMENAPADWGSQPEEALHQNEFILILRECIKALPKKIAAVFTLREMEGIESNDVCKELDITSSNLWVMLHRARNQLRTCLELNWFAADVEGA
jgi:RNA polymerase sigma-70 factor (ECF subfamily)